jgi:hypothetical protein
MRDSIFLIPKLNGIALAGREIAITFDPGAAHSTSLHARYLADFYLPHSWQKFN